MVEEVKWLCKGCGFHGTNENAKFCPQCGRDRKKEDNYQYGRTNPSKAIELGYRPI